MFFFVSESSTVKAIRQAAAAVCSLSETEFDIRFNPDIFSPSAKHALPLSDSKSEEENAEGKEAAKSQKYPSIDLQIKLNKEACEFLVLFQIPTFVRDITANR